MNNLPILLIENNKDCILFTVNWPPERRKITVTQP